MITDADLSSVVFAVGPCSNYQWVAAGPNPCHRCAELDGEIRSFSSWASSVMPGLHRHCHCILVPIDEKASGMIFTSQFPYLTKEDILNAISAFFVPLAPARFHNHHLFDEPEGASDLVPYQPTKADILEAITPEIDWSTVQPNND